MALLILKWPLEWMGDCLGDWRTTFSAKIIQIKRCPEMETEN